jgi:hypothetical protein
MPFTVTRLSRDLWPATTSTLLLAVPTSLAICLTTSSLAAPASGAWPGRGQQASTVPRVSQAGLSRLACCVRATVHALSQCHARAGRAYSPSLGASMVRSSTPPPSAFNKLSERALGFTCTCSTAAAAPAPPLLAPFPDIDAKCAARPRHAPHVPLHASPQRS